MIAGTSAGFWAVPSLSICPTKDLPGLSAHICGQKHGAGLAGHWLLSHNRKTRAGRMVATKLLTTEFLLLILSVPAVADSITHLAGRDAGHSVIAQEACLVIGGCTEAVHWRKSKKYFIFQHFHGMRNRSRGIKEDF